MFFCRCAASSLRSDVVSSLRSLFMSHRNHGNHRNLLASLASAEDLRGMGDDFTHQLCFSNLDPSDHSSRLLD